MAREQKFTATEDTALLEFLRSQLSHYGRNKVKGLLTHRQVAVDGAIVTRHDVIVHPGQTVTILSTRGPDVKAMHGVKILFEDDDLLVVDKPPGLLTVATDQERTLTVYHILTDYVQQQNPQNRIFIVHRLDRDTSGVLMFAKRQAVQTALQDTWKTSVLERAYVVVVEGKVTPEQGILTSWLKQSRTQTMYIAKPGDGQKAVLHYRVLQTQPEYSLLQVQLGTGRKNQIRVQLQSIGHSVVGDKRYGAKRDPLHRLGLHARVLSFRHPVTKAELRFETPIPPGFLRLFTV